MRTAGSFQPGDKRINRAGRPRKGLALIDVLLSELEKKKNKSYKKRLLCQSLIDIAIDENQCTADRLKATGKVFNILQRNHEFEIKLEKLEDIENKIEELERRLDNGI